jgi:copper chaperone CopZ
VPIAAALVGKGASLGAVLVFLMTGPATNVATITTVAKTLGRRALAVYLASIAVGSLAFGLAVDWIATPGVAAGVAQHGGHDLLPPWVGHASAVALVALMAWGLLSRYVARPATEEAPPAPGGPTSVFTVTGMTCDHCAGAVRRAAESVDGVTSAGVDLSTGSLVVTGSGIDAGAVAAAVREAGYSAEPKGSG